MFDLKKYREIKNRLKLNFRDDGKARDILEGFVGDWDYDAVEKLIKNRVVFIFGCGPSLECDVREVADRNLHHNAAVIAADGAAKALLEHGVKPDICVTDLDGDLMALQKAGEKGCLMVVHAHGDNMDAIREILPKIPGMKLGTTQVKPAGRIRNFGGFTDGDRAVYLAVHFNAGKIVLFGMDFGNTAGRYSGVRKNRRAKKAKLDVGRRLLEELAGRTPIPILNATKKGVDLENIKRTDINRLTF
jgi:hypothetical protein